ncbi:MAG: SAM-dependent DNA methyltransferase [Gammaproteobacteria bacterium]
MNAKIEFGDFQTPRSLARDVCSVIERTGFSPASVIEPTCGRGAFLLAALEAFPRASHFLGVDQKASHVREATRATNSIRHDGQVQILRGDFFDTDWSDMVARLPKPILIVGNPPWVTNATLGSLGSANLPAKANKDNLRGIDALTGKSNFDISEWMLRKNIQWLADTPGMLGVLCKMAVARKVLFYGWSQGLPIESAEVRRIDAQLHFGASVNACLLVVRLQPGASSKECSDYGSLQSTEPDAVFGLRDANLVADVRLYDRWHDLLGRGLSGWRSGIKHDCSNVFELVQKDAGYENGMGKRVDLEPEVLFPLLKSSDVARNRHPRKWLLVPQRTMSASPDDLQRFAPKAWQYLLANEALLDKRGSSIYRNRPRFSIFGVGEYSFSPWKVAISGLYKKLEFVKVPPLQARPVVLDDTCYFFSCQSERECHVLHELVQSEPARGFWSALVFWDAKRPITAQILNLLDFAALARATGMESEIARVLAERQLVRYTEGSHQQLLFREEPEEYGIDPNGGTDE